MSERELRERIVKHGRSLFDRGLTSGSSGNISVRLPDGMLITPTNCCLGDLDPYRIAKVSHNGDLIEGDIPSKEAFLHQAMYRSRDSEQAIVHLHSTYSVAVSCLEDVDPNDVLPPMTAYYVMRVGALPMAPYFPPGDDQLATAIENLARHSHAVLLANHGPVVAGKTLDAAVHATEELEETARLFLLLRGQATRVLSQEECRELKMRFPH